jgi:Haem-degrading
MRKAPLLLLVMALTACSGGDPVATSTGADPTGGCSGTCGGSTTSLTVADVQQVIAQAVAEAQGRSVTATIAVVDRVGNVLAVYRMGAAASRSVTITTSPGGATVSGGLESIRLPVAPAPVNIDHAAAIAKAVTGAYLSSEGNAFSSRTAS